MTLCKEATFSIQNFDPLSKKLIFSIKNNITKFSMEHITTFPLENNALLSKIKKSSPNFSKDFFLRNIRKICC